VDSLVSAEHDDRIGDRVEDRLGAFALVDDLIDACAERSHIRERQHGAGDLAITLCVGRYADGEGPVPIAKIRPGLTPLADDLAALLLQAGQAGENRDSAGRPTNVRWERRSTSAAALLKPAIVKSRRKTTTTELQRYPGC